jgi:hypothetical protein
MRPTGIGALIKTPMTVTGTTVTEKNTKSAVKIGIEMTGTATGKPAIMILIRIGTIPATAIAIIATTMTTIVNAESCHRRSWH